MAATKEKKKATKMGKNATNARTLVLIDLENLINAVREIDAYLKAHEAHKVCEVSGYSSLSWKSQIPKKGRKLPECVKHKEIRSNGKEAADVLMMYDAGRLLAGAAKKYKSVLIVSDDHFAARLQEILSIENVRARQVGKGQSVVKALRALM